MAARFQAHRATTGEYVELLRVSPTRVTWACDRPSLAHPVIAAAVWALVMGLALVAVWIAIAWGGVVIGTALGMDMHGGLPTS